MLEIRNNVNYDYEYFALHVLLLVYNVNVVFYYIFIYLVETLNILVLLVGLSYVMLQLFRMGCFTNRFQDYHRHQPDQFNIHQENQPDDVSDTKRRFYG